MLQEYFNPKIRGDILLRAGYTDDRQAAELLNACINDVCQAAQPKTIYRKLPIEKTEPLLAGEDVRKHLQNCSQCLIIAATLGIGIDKLLLRAAAEDTERLLLTDIVANTAIEAFCDKFQNELAESTFDQENAFLTSRYSPGYGDFPLSTSAQILKILEAGKRIGLMITPNHLLTPRKSITAVIGISAIKTPTHDCDNCAIADTCDYNKNKRGKTDEPIS